MKDLTDASRKNVFIIDDSLFNRTSCKKTELGSKVFDHTGMNYKKGYRMLTLSWSDGNTLIPVNSCLLASSKESNIIGPVKAFDKRTLAGKRRKLAQTKAPEAMLTLLDTAVSAGLSAEYVLFDSWFSNPAQITAIKRKGMDVIAMIKKSSRIKYTYNDEQLNIKEIYSKNKKRRGRSKYLLSVDVIVGKENPIPAKIVCVRNTSLSEEEIIRIYGKRWQIEVFFKTCKSMLNLIGECHSLSYDALTAHVAIVFTRYMLLATEQRQNEDQRTLGELFFFLVDEMADITFSRSLGILMDALMASLQEILKLSDEQLSALIADFESRLPEYLRNALHPGTAMA
nr:transposase [uncultured Blautia sp.]